MKNKNQLLFFFLCVVVAAALFLFLYAHRTREHAYTAQLEKEASSESSAESAPATVTAAPVSSGASTVAPQNMINNETASADTTSTAPAADTAAPQITLKSDTVTIPVGGAFNYMDYIADMTDDKDDRSTLNREVELDGSVDTGKAGDYNVTYTVRDSSGKLSNKVTLKVTVQ